MDGKRVDDVYDPEVKLSLVVGKEIQQAKEFPMYAPGRGDIRGEDVRMTQGAILRRVSSAAMEVKKL